MKQIDSQRVSPLDNYKLLSGLVAPRPIAWISTWNAGHHNLNLAPFSFFSVVPGSRPLVTVAIGRIDGQPKDTTANLLREHEGVVNLVDRQLAAQMNMTAASLPSGESEVDLAKLTTVDSQRVTTPGIAGSKARLEVKLDQVVPIKNRDGETDADLLILEVVNYDLADQVVGDRYHVDTTALDPIARIAGPNYSRLGERLSMARPK